jgi:hypothetical protein
MAIFISHSTADDDFVADLRRRLEAHGLPVWVDSRQLRGGDKLNPAIEQAIRAADHCVVVLGPRTVNSPWVRREIHQAEAVAREREGFQVVPLLLDGIEPGALALWFEEEPRGGGEAGHHRPGGDLSPGLGCLGGAAPRRLPAPRRARGTAPGGPAAEAGRPQRRRGGEDKEAVRSHPSKESLGWDRQKKDSGPAGRCSPIP